MAKSLLHIQLKCVVVTVEVWSKDVDLTKIGIDSALLRVRLGRLAGYINRIIILYVCILIAGQIVTYIPDVSRAQKP